MTGAEFAETIRAAAAAAARRSAARAPAILDTYTRNRQDIEQAAALDVLERIERGDPADLVQLAHRAANAALIREYRREHDRRTVPAEIETDDGDRIPRPELYRPQDAPRRPEEAAEAADLVQSIVTAIPAAYRADAPRALYMTAAGYTAQEIGDALQCSSRRIERLLHAARDAAKQIDN